MAEVTVSLPENVLREIDEAAQAQRRTRNELLQEAAELYLREQRTPHRWEDPSVLDAVATQAEIRRQDHETSWDAVAEIRRMRESRG